MSDTHTTISEIESLDAFQLMGMAECRCDSQVAAAFLTGIRDTFVEQYDWHRENDSLESLLTDYAGDLFRVMVDTAAWAEDVSDYGTPNDLLQATQWAVFMVADRLGARAGRVDDGRIGRVT